MAKIICPFCTQLMSTHHPPIILSLCPLFEAGKEPFPPTPLRTNLHVILHHRSIGIISMSAQCTPLQHPLLQFSSSSSSVVSARASASVPLSSRPPSLASPVRPIEALLACVPVSDAVIDADAAAAAAARARSCTFGTHFLRHRRALQRPGWLTVLFSLLRRRRRRAAPA